MDAAFQANDNSFELNSCAVGAEANPPPKSDLQGLWHMPGYRGSEFPLHMHQATALFAGDQIVAVSRARPLGVPLWDGAPFGLV